MACQSRNALKSSNLFRLDLIFTNYIKFYFRKQKRDSELSNEDTGSSHSRTNINNQTETISNAATTSSKLSKTDDEVNSSIGKKKTLKKS